MGPTKQNEDIDADQDEIGLMMGEKPNNIDQEM